MTEYADVPADVLAELRSICGQLPETHEEQAWAGRRWQVRRRTFAHVLTVEAGAGPTTVMSFRSTQPEIEALFGQGHPFFRPGWGTNVVGMVLDPGVDWDEVRELVTDSYVVMAPKKLARLVLGPNGG